MGGVGIPRATKGTATMAKKPNKIEDWEANDAAGTLVRAEEIRGNRPLMAAAQRQITKQQKALSRAATPVKPAKKRAAKKAVRKTVAKKRGR